MPVAYDAYGRPMMAPGMPGMMPGWPHGAGGVMGQQHLALPNAAYLESKNAKKEARREARREYERLEDEKEKEKSARVHAEERRSQRRRHNERAERERHYAKLENRDVRKARGVAEDDARERIAMEEAQADAFNRREKNDFLMQKEQAIYDAQQKAFEREQLEVSQQDSNLQYGFEEHKRMMQAQALEAAQNAALAGEPLDRYSQRTRVSKINSVASIAASSYNSPNGRYDRMSNGSIHSLAQSQIGPEHETERQFQYEYDEYGVSHYDHHVPPRQAVRQYTPRPQQYSQDYEPQQMSCDEGIGDDYQSAVMSHMASPAASALGARSETVTEKLRLQVRMQEERERVLDQQYADRMRDDLSYLAPAFGGSKLPSLRSVRSAYSVRSGQPGQLIYPH